MIIPPIYRQSKKYTVLCRELSNMKIILYKHIEYSRVATSPRSRPSSLADYSRFPTRHRLTYFFLNGATGNGIIINWNLLFGHQSESKTERGVNILVFVIRFTLSSSGPILCNQRLDEIKWNSTIYRMLDSNNRVCHALEPPYVGHIKFISIILLVWSSMIAFITFIDCHRENSNLWSSIA